MMWSLNLESPLVPDKLVLRWKSNVGETRKDELRENQSLDKKTE